MFVILAQFVTRGRWYCVAVWLAAAVLLALAAPSREQIADREPTSLLPPNSPLNVSMQVLVDAFPEQAARSNIVLIFHRPGGLTSADHDFLKALARKLADEADPAGPRWRVQSPHTSPAMRLRLSSADGAAAMIVLHLDANFITQRAAQAVEKAEKPARADLPNGLVMEVTGSAGIGREHNARSKAALERTTRVTIAAVLIILVLVYRSPLGALVPLVSIGLCVFISLRVLDLLALAGWAVSDVERTFTIVLLFGAGTDYALFWIARYREELTCGRDGVGAATAAMTRVGPAILASAGTTTLGLMMLVFADMVVIHNCGKVLGIVLAIALLAAMTLTPALTLLLGDAFFWPGAASGGFTVGRRHLWPAVAKFVVGRPLSVFLTVLILLGVPAFSSWRVPLRYDSFGDVPAGTSAARGLQLAREHFSEEELFSTRFLIRSDAFIADSEFARTASAEVAARIGGVEGVGDVWHLGAPLGRRRSPELSAVFGSSLLRDAATGFYLATDKGILQLEVMQRHPPLSPRAVDVFRQVQREIRSWADEKLGQDKYSLYAVGQTPYIVDVRSVADRDMIRIVGVVVLVIWIVVLALIRRFLLAAFMLVATLITYGATLGLTGWVFVDLLGRSGVDYKLRILLFVVIVAIGQDYNIFLVSRLLEEIKSFDLREAVGRSIVLTGPIISSCGLIMAATLGSLGATGIDLTEQLGFAFAVGILLDTFLVRPMLIPSFYLLTERLRS